VPAVLKRGDLAVAVSTAGKSPALARKLREELEDRFGREYGSLLNLMGELRKEVLSHGLSQEQNKRIFKELVDSEILSAIRKEDWKRAALIVNRILPRPLAEEEILRRLEAA